jgi:UDP-MurNAc hydroxylase
MSQFKLTYIGHAGWLVEAPDFRCLCDPWFNPAGAFFSQWLPFPDNAGLLKPELLKNLDFVYVSHAHEDHFDPMVLGQIEKDTNILIPRFKDPILRSSLKKLGFTNITEMTRDDEWSTKNITARIIEDDGYLDQDSCLVLDDGNNKILNLNDCHMDFSTIEKYVGSVEVLLLQATSAIWWPCAYDYVDEELKQKCRQKRNNAVRRAVSYAKTLNAKLTIPNAGPPFFRDRSLHHWNETRRHDDNPFILADDAALLMQKEGLTAHALVPGDSISVGHQIEVHRDREKHTAIYEHLSDYIREYTSRVQDKYPVSPRTPTEHTDMVQKFKKCVQDICSHSHIYAPLLTFWVLFDFDGVEKVAVNFSKKSDECIVPYTDSLLPEINYQFVLCPHSMCELLNGRHIDFERFFLGTNFKCHRDPDVYNEVLFTLLKNFDLQRLLISEKIYAERKELLNETFQLDHNGKTYEVQRHCPHMLADLQRSGYINEQGNLVCALHGWEFQLESGNCLNNHKCSLGVKELKS